MELNQNQPPSLGIINQKSVEMFQKSPSVETTAFGSMTHVVNPGSMQEQRRESVKSGAKSDVTDKRKKRASESPPGPSMQGRAYETHGIRFVPAEVLFYNAFRGQCYTTIITIINISAHTMHLAISQPYSSAFHIKDDGTTIAIAPGLSIARKIIYKCSEGKLFDSVIPIRVGHSLILFPVKVIPGQVHVTVEPSYVSFGRIDLGSAFVTSTVQLQNKGSIAAKFAIDLSKNELDIMITPRMGTIKPYHTAEIRIQLAGLVVGEHETEFWVKTTPPCRFVVWVTVVVPFLRAIHPFATEEFTLLDIKPTFPGTYRYDTLLVRNASSDMSSVVVLCECDGLVMSPSQAANEDPCFKHFRLNPSDGTLAPFENRIFTMWFSPKAPKHEIGWKRLLGREKTSYYLCFFRIQRVTVTHFEGGDSSPIQSDEKRCQLDVTKEYSEDEPTTLSSKAMNAVDTMETNNIIRVCAYASSVTPRLHIVPDELIFENVKIGHKLDRVLRIHNPCELPLGFAYVKQAHVTVIHKKSEFIQPGKSVEILVQLHARSLRFERNRLVFELLSHKNMTDGTNIVVIGQVSIRLSVSIKSEPKALEPAFLPGITPRMHLEGEEVGLHTEIVLFSPKNMGTPNAVVWPKSGDGKPWLSSDARVAFPNERRRSLRVTAHDGNVRSIFTGKLRYNVPPNPSNVYSPKELEFKTQQLTMYKKYVSEQAAMKMKYLKMQDSELPLPEEYDIDDEKLYALLGTFPPVPVPEYKLNPDRPQSHEVLCPLTPLQLFNIKVQPQVVDFGKMPPKTDCSTNIAVDNMNSFPIAVKFKTYKESLKVAEDAFIVPGQSTKIQKITLFLESIGKHYTNMSYVINTYHSYDIKVCAEVETRYLITEPGELSFRETSDRDVFEKNFLPVKITNPLGSKSAFKWKIAPGSPFGVVPSSGIVPARSSLVCSVFFNLKSGNQLGSVLVLQVDDGLGSHFPVNFIPSNRFSLTLFSPKISCQNISLGVLFTKKIIIYNHGRRACCFSVEDLELPKGVKILPFTGTVQPRSCFTLNVQLFFMEIKKFSFKIPIYSMTMRNIHLTCNGFVTYPLVTFQPKHFLFRTTPVHSHSCATFTMTNESEADVKVKFLMREFPQFKISSSSDFADTAATLGASNATLAALETRILYFHFEPHDIAGYSFLLPVVINNILGPPVLSNPMSLLPCSYVTVPLEGSRQPSAVKISGMTAPEKLDTITVEVSVQRGYIKCSSFVFEFFKTDVKEKGGQTLVIENILTHGSVTVRIKTPNPESEPFSIQSKSEPLQSMEPITLEEKDQLELVVVFQPSGAGTYSTGVSIYVDEYSKDRPYTILKMTGVFYRSSLACVSSMVNFIPVCLEVEIDKIIYIMANHQPEDTKLSVEIVGMKEESLEELFTVVFPNTNNIPYGIDNFVIPVKIKFRSDAPIAVVAILTAKDGYDGECSVTITAMADRSTLTTHAYQFINSLPKMVAKDNSASMSKRSLMKDRTQSNMRIDSEKSDSNAKAVIGSVHNYEGLGESSANLTTPITGAIIEEIEQFPLFPKSISESVYAIHMRRTKKAMEDWIYEQGFQGQYRMTIGEMVYYSEQYQSALQSTNKNSHFGDVKNILDLIIKLTGREFTTQYPLPPNIPQDKGGRIGHAILAYIAILTFLTRQGGRLIHVSPLYLLEYDDYKFYHEKLKPLHLQPSSSFHGVSQMDVVMGQETYERLTIQCWLDVFLQLYKVLVFYPAMSETTKSSDVTIHSGSSDKVNVKLKSKLQIKLSQHAASLTIADSERGEDYLLNWMNEIFTVSRPTCLPPRQITNFQSDLEDGVVLALITSHFCPFLQEHWSNIYWNPANKSESQQNLAILSLVWNKIRIGLTIRSHDLKSPHSVKMLMLSCLLYTVLPSYLPYETLFFEACLADTVHKHLKLTNPSDHGIGYAIKTFDPSNAFSLGNRKKSIYIQSGGSCNLDINFFAKSINKVIATLVLCGSYVPGGYAKNLVFILKGMPVKLQHKFAVNITCPLYKTAKVKANLNSPFTQEGEFTICLAENEPKPGKYKPKLWSQMIKSKVIRSIYLSDTTMEVPASMELPVPINIHAGALQLKTKEYWIIFSNQKIGDFLVKVSIIPDMRAPQHILHPPFPTRRCVAASEKSCDDPNCPRIVHVQIPSKNLKLWSAAKAMLSHTLNDVEKTFWDDYLETPLGLKLMAWISRQYHIGQSDMSFLFQSKVTYKVECNSPSITCPSFITIEDVRSNKPIDLPIHVSNTAKPAMAVDIKLRTENELRYYQLVMRKPVVSGQSGTSSKEEATLAKGKNDNEDQETCNFPCQDISHPR